MPLTFATIGETAIVKEIRGKDDTRRFLENLGFVAGGHVTVITETAGNLIVNVKDTRIALSKSMANRILIGMM